MFRAAMALVTLVVAFPAEAHCPNPHVLMRQWHMTMLYQMRLNQMLLRSQAYQRLARSERQVLSRERAFVNHPNLRNTRRLENALQHEGAAMNRYLTSHAFAHWLNGLLPRPAYEWASITVLRPPLVVPLSPTHHRPHLTAWGTMVIAEPPLPGHEIVFFSQPWVTVQMPSGRHHHQSIYTYNPFGTLLSMTVFAPGGETFFISANAL
jgi:hypothetical protein